MDANAGQCPPTSSALYTKLRRANVLRLLEEDRLPREEQLRQELRDYMDAHAGQSPPTTSALYTKLRRADMLRLLEEGRLPREEQLRQELRDYMDANAGQSPPTTSALYTKLRRADMLRLLEEERLPREEQLRQELRDYMDANAGQCPPTTSALYTKLRRAEMLRLLKDMLPRGQGPDTAPLDEQLRGGVFKFVADKTVLDCLPYLADLPGTAFQRYSHDAAAARRCCFADIVIALCRGFASAAFFSMHSLSVDEQTAALDWLETCPVATSDDTASVRARVESFCVAESRWPDKDGGHSSDLELVTAIRKVRSRRFGVVVNKRKGVLSDYALPLNEDQMLAWEALPLHSCFLWWPHHAKVFEEVQELWQNEQSLPVRGPQSASDALAQKVRRVRMKTLLTGRKAMRVAERITWEEAFPSIWQRRMQKEANITVDRFRRSLAFSTWSRSNVYAGL